MGSQKKKTKFLAKGGLKTKLKQRNEKRKFQALKDKKKNKFERNTNVKTSRLNSANIEYGKKEESDMLDDMDVDEFLNAEFLESDENDEIQGNESEDEDVDDNTQKKDEDIESSSEEEDEDALDPRYMTGSMMPAEDEDEDDENEQVTEEHGQGQEVIDDENTEKQGSHVVSMEELLELEKSCYEAYTIGGLRKILKMFSDACRAGVAADMQKEGEIVYKIQSSAVYNRLMFTVLRKTQFAFAKQVSSASTIEEKESSSEVKTKVDLRKWQKQALLIRRFFSCCLHLLEHSTGQDIPAFVLRELGNYMQYIVPCIKTARKMLKVLLKVWANTNNTNVCILAFVRIRDLAVQMPFPFLELCLKGIYISYMRNTKFTSESLQQHQTLLGNCVVELYGIDISSSYQHAFIYIRQLAIAIRKTITSPSATTFKTVLNRQFLNQLRLWTAVVCAYPQENELKALLYPLCQLMFALVRLSSTLRYIPLRFHCVKLLQQLALVTGSFVPTSPILLQVLQIAPYSTSYHKTKGKKSKSTDSSTNIDVHLDISVKLSTSELDNKRVHDALIERLFELLQQESDVYQYHIGYPELCVPIQLTLNKFMSTCSIPKWKAIARGVNEEMTKRADFIRRKRSGLEISPKDVKLVDGFLQTERQAATQKIVTKAMNDWQVDLNAEKKNREKNIVVGSKRAKDASDMEEFNDTTEVSTENEPKSKKTRRTKRRKNVIDAETIAKVKGMSVDEFKYSIQEVDEDDQVEDFVLSDEED